MLFLAVSLFSSYHRFTKQSSYIKVKKGIQNLIAVNVQGTKPEYAKELVNCCCNYFDIFEGTIIDGISVQKESINRLRLDIDEFEKTILQTACVLWVNRIPIEELETKGRLINLKIDFSPVEKGFINISAYIVKNLAVSFFEKTVCALDNEERFKNLNTKNKRNIINFIERVETLAKEHSISIKNMDSEKTRCRIQRFKYGNSSVRYLTSFMSRFKFYREDFYQINPQLNVYEKKKRKEFEKSIHELYLDTISRLKKENDKVALFYPLEYTRKRAVENLHRDAKARNIDKSAIKKLSYLLASFKVFASLCLPEADGAILSSQVKQALLATLINQTRESAQEILEKYLFSLIQTHRYARIRGNNSNRKDIAVWYDPKREYFLLPSATYFIHLKEAYSLSISKAQYENELVEAGVIRTDERKRPEGRQTRRTFERVLTCGGRKESVLEIPQANLSHGFIANDVVEWAIEEMCSDSTPLRSRRE